MNTCTVYNGTLSKINTFVANQINKQTFTHINTKTGGTNSTIFESRKITLLLFPLTYWTINSRVTQFHTCSSPLEVSISVFTPSLIMQNPSELDVLSLHTYLRNFQVINHLCFKTSSRAKWVDLHGNKNSGDARFHLNSL